MTAIMLTRIDDQPTCVGSIKWIYSPPYSASGLLYANGGGLVGRARSGLKRTERVETRIWLWLSIGYAS